MPSIESLYTVGLHLTGAVLPLFGRGESKLSRGIRGRIGSVDRIEVWGQEARDRERPLAWFHAPSVGEGQQAGAVIEALKARLPDLQVAYTYFSPSAESFSRALPVDVSDYLPLDLPKNVERMFDALIPDVISFTKTEVWPNVTREAERRGVPVALLSATLPGSSSRTGRAARHLLSPAHARLSMVAAISPDDAARFQVLGVPADRITTMGDARFDQVWRRASEGSGSAAAVEALRAPHLCTVVAGSTWPADEDHLLPAFSALREAGDSRRLILVPHEPSRSHLARLESRIAAAQLGGVRLSALNGREPDGSIVIVDRVGILGDLYRLADVAYVGGGFGKSGLHSVLEPAAFGVPVLFGPNHFNAREAAELISAGAARSVASRYELKDALEIWLENAYRRERAGTAARRYAEAGTGAAERGAEILLACIGDGDRPQPPSSSRSPSA